MVVVYTGFKTRFTRPISFKTTSMKKALLNLLATAVFLCSAVETAAQRIIDISTGVNNTNGQNASANSAVPYNSIDDSWTVAYAPWSAQGSNIPTPNANAFQSAAISNGVSVTNMCYGPAITHPQNPGTMWISPNVDAQGRYIDAIFGDYFYKSVFTTTCQNVMPCSQQMTIKSVKLNLNYIATDLDLIEVRVNGYVIPGVNLGMSYNSTFSFFYASNFSAVIPTNMINTNGSNAVVLVINDPGDLCNNYYNDGIARSPTAINVKGNITIEYNMDADLKDKYGNTRDEFCMDEDVFVSSVGPNLDNNYKLSVFKINSGVPSQIGGIQSIGSSPAMINVTKLIEKGQNPPYVFAPGDYEVRLSAGTLTGYYGCGAQTVIKPFKYKCCNNPDATFQLQYANGKLEGKGTLIGTHSWQVYSAANANAGPYTPISTLDGPKFSINSEGFCYYVKHAVTVPGCGTSCAAQSICNFSCEDKTCNLSAPAWIAYNSLNSVLSWAAVAGASSYIIQININDPMCCSNNTSGLYISKMLTSTTNSRPLNQLTDLGYASKPFCFSWKVYAVCPDGTPSFPSVTKCSNAVPGTDRKAASGLGDAGLSLDESFSAAVYPNPASGMVFIDVAGEGEFDIEVFDVTGKMVKAMHNQKVSGKTSNIRWNIADQEKGVYLVKISASTGALITKKLVIE